MAYFSRVGVTTDFVMTTINDFKVASFEKKCEHVTTQSNYITSRSDEQKKVYLYHSGKYFVEVYYAPVLKRVLLIRAFNDASSLFPYTESISLEDLKL
jgi:hypothetical protein